MTEIEKEEGNMTPAHPLAYSILPERRYCD
jgi:hypothetical protein